MNTSLKTLLLATALTSVSALADDCALGDAPGLPNGASSSMDEMVAGQQSVKAFQADALAYRACLDEGMKAIESAAAEGDEDAADNFKIMTDAYNASVATEEALANDFNAEIRAYKAANPS